MGDVAAWVGWRSRRRKGECVSPKFDLNKTVSVVVRRWYRQLTGIPHGGAINARGKVARKRIRCWTLSTFVLMLIVGVIVGWLWSLGNWESRSQFGDATGVFSALFSGLALIGVVWTLRMQSRELTYQRKELELTRREHKGAKKAQEALAHAARETYLLEIRPILERDLDEVSKVPVVKNHGKGTAFNVVARVRIGSRHISGSQRSSRVIPLDTCQGQKTVPVAAPGEIESADGSAEIGGVDERHPPEPKAAVVDRLVYCDILGNRYITDHNEQGAIRSVSAGHDRDNRDNESICGLSDGDFETLISRYRDLPPQ